MSFFETKIKVLEWALYRYILTDSNPHRQYDKLVEEVSELKEDLDNIKLTKIKDDIGDIMIVLTILSFMIGLDIEDCYDTAYHKIKDNKGTIINGLFVKDNGI